jgi:hypothetical protein
MYVLQLGFLTKKWIFASAIYEMQISKTSTRKNRPNWGMGWSRSRARLLFARLSAGGNLEIFPAS